MVEKIYTYPTRLYTQCLRNGEARLFAASDVLVSTRMTGPSAVLADKSIADAIFGSLGGTA